MTTRETAGKVRIGTCSGPLDATLVRSYFLIHDIPFSITSWLDIEVDARDEERGRACLRKLRAPGCSLDVTLQGSGHFEHLDDELAIGAVTPPAFEVERHQAPRPVLRREVDVPRRASRARRFATMVRALRRALRFN